MTVLEMGPGISLRPSTPADLAFITALERHLDNRDYIGQWTGAEHLSAMAGENHRSHSIIERDGKPEGYLIAYDRRAEGAGIYVKRLLVNGKGRGTGSEALRIFVEKAFAEGRTEFVWLLVRDWNERAKAVYRKLGFIRFDPHEEEARRFNSAADTPKDSFRMILRKG
jgi:ribosomal protein S18 acetylase RimI-like enzyme